MSLPQALDLRHVNIVAKLSLPALGLVGEALYEVAKSGPARLKFGVGRLLGTSPNQSGCYYFVPPQLCEFCL